MKEFVAFHLYGPVASWGDIAVGEYRPTFSHPSKSAIMGLLAASLGIKREEEEKHQALSKSYGMAIRVDADGILLRDYHTIQVPPAGSGKRKKSFATRKEELAGPKEDLKTILSSRDYRCDALYSILIWKLDETAPFSLGELVERLKKPVFVPYLGRKSCPLALPLQARLIQSENIRNAFEKMALAGDELLQGLARSSQVNIYWEGEDMRLSAVQTIIRRDMLLSRRRWQFTNRTENHLTLGE